VIVVAIILGAVLLCVAVLCMCYAPDSDDAEQWHSGPFCKHWNDPAGCRKCADAAKRALRSV